ncbi:MAG: hypothetical protein ABIJ39_08725 [Chloroflexota bacterium]
MQTTSIPQSLAPFFQEYRLSDLDPAHAAATIIERTLQYGNRAEIRWLFATYPHARITAWLRQNGAERLPEPHLTFWRLVLGVLR